ncbi:MAG: hypothetical protein LBV06_02295 [Propionibacteriaceae bacterium]|jgi:dissimilatory sulfite reductase (desulfoviridin) alpha/beta subunit|nr:hypothetical protein [Propionibacteriaceae bacterium]
MFAYTGRSIEVKYDTGYHFRIDYLPNHQMRWTSLKKRTDGAPMTGVETYHLHQQGEHIFTLNWIEDSGLSVSQNLDFTKLEVYAFMSWNDSTARGGRAILEHQGKITLL